MTQNEAKAYIADEKNWHVIATSEYVIVKRLEYRSLAFIAIDTKHMNMARWYLDNETVHEWSTSFYYEFSTEHDCLTTVIRPTNIEVLIWKESKK